MSNTADIVTLSRQDRTLQIKGGVGFFKANINGAIKPGRYFLGPMMVPDKLTSKETSHPELHNNLWKDEKFWWKLYASERQPSPYPPPGWTGASPGRPRDKTDGFGDYYYVPRPDDNPPPGAGFHIAGMESKSPSNYRYSVTVHSQEFVKSLLARVGTRPVRVWPHYEGAGGLKTRSTPTPVLVYQFPLKFVLVV